MFIRPIFLLFLLLLILIPAAHSAPVDDWNALIVQGSKQKFEGKYDVASQYFAKAVAFAQKEKLPDKYLPISLCRMAEAQLNANMVKEADSHFDQITTLIKTQKSAGKLDGQVGFWAAALADAYLSNHKPETRELCLKHACYLKTLVYGANHRNSIDCLNKLAEYYIDENKVDKALKILEINEGLIAKQFGKDPNRFGNLLNDLAIKCEKEHKYNQAKQLELEVIKIARTNKSSLNDGLPAFYCFLSINALDQDQSTESKKYMQQAVQACSKITNPKKKYHLQLNLAPLVDVCNADSNKVNSNDVHLNNRKYHAVEARFKNLLKIHQVAKTEPNTQYVIYTLLAANIGCETDKNVNEHTMLLQKAIDIVSSPSSPCSKDIPGLYTRMAMALHDRDLKKADELFAKGVDAAKGPNAESANILYQWGGALKDTKQFKKSTQKFNAAYQQIRSLPPEKRGTVLVDLLQTLAIEQREQGKDREAELTLKRAAEELKVQKKLNTKLAIPARYHSLEINK